MNNFGSFGNVSPDAMSAIKEALARRQQGGSVPALNQQSGASPTQAPLQPEPQGAMPMPDTATVGAEAPTENLPAGVDDEAKLIISALKERLSALSKTMPGMATYEALKRQDAQRKQNSQQ